jgi:isoleucyl-tRNA synthetase
VHLADWPAAAARDLSLEVAMATARETVRLGLAARGQAKVKVRQPLREAVIVAAGREREAIEQLADVVRDELNVESLRFVEEAGELGSYEVKANYRTLGPRFGKRMPELVNALSALDPSHVAGALREGRTVGVVLSDGEDHPLGADDLQLAMQPLEGYQLEREGTHAVALDLHLDEGLRRRGLAREVIHAVQNARKNAGLAVEDRIALRLGGDDELLGVVREHEQLVAGEALANSIEIEPGLDSGAQVAAIEGRELRIAVERAG